MPRADWIGQQAKARSVNVDTLSLLNGFAEVVESRQGKTPVALHGTPGLKRLLTLPGAGQVRALYTAPGTNRCFAVQGNQLYEINADWTTTLRGTISTLAGQVSIKDNGIAMVLVDNPNGYIFTFADNTLAPITDGIFVAHGAVKVDFLDNYLVFIKNDSQEWFWSNLLSTDFDGLNVATAEGAPDGLVSMLAMRRELWLFGSTRTEVWVTTGDADTPFARLPSGFLMQGCAARHSPARVGETICWLASDDQGHAQVVQAQGLQGVSISGHAITQALEAYSVLDDAIGWGQQQGGHQFYWLTFPHAQATWCYDLATGLWHQRGYLDLSTGTVGRHRANAATFAFGKHLAGDYVDGRIYALDPGTYDDDGNPLVFTATLPAFYDADLLGLVRYDYVRIDAETGVGRDGGVIPGTDPQMALRISDDGGHTWTPERWEPLGQQGEYRTAVEWWQLGASDDRRYQVTISDPVKRVILGAYTQAQRLG
jgi:hypothetical protein